LYGIATLAAAAALPEFAACLFAAAADHPAIGSAPTLPDRTGFERAPAVVRSKLDPETFSQAWANGQAMLPLTTLTDIETGLSAASASPTPTTVAEPDTAGLTERGNEGLRLLADKLTDREIAEGLFIIPRADMRRLANALGKLDANTRTAAVSYARGHGIT